MHALTAGGKGHRLRPPALRGAVRRLADAAGRESRIIDAVGPETFTYRERVELIASAIGKKRLTHYAPRPPPQARTQRATRGDLTWHPTKPG